MCSEPFALILEDLATSIDPRVMGMTCFALAVVLGTYSLRIYRTLTYSDGLHHKANDQLPCDFVLCDRYPDEIRSTKIIGERQFQKAADLFTSATEKLTGSIDYRHVYLNFTDIEVELNGNKKVKTCPAAVGPGFAAGTTDGPGFFGFQQGDTKVSTFWAKSNLQAYQSSLLTLLLTMVLFTDTREIYRT